MAIAYDNTGTGSGTTTCTFNHVLGFGAGQNRLVCVVVTIFGNPGTVTPSVTFNTVAMTLVRQDSTSDGLENTSIFYMLDASLPAGAGTYSVVVSSSGSGSQNVAAVSMSMTGVKQVAPEAQAGAGSAGSSGTTISAVITTLTNNAWIIASGGGSGATTSVAWTDSDGQIVGRGTATSGGGASLTASGATDPTAVAGAETNTVTFGVALNRFSISLAAWPPFSGGGGTDDDGTFLGAEF